MKIRIDFSIFTSSPLTSFAYALGDLDLPQVPAAGAAVDLLQGKQLPHPMPTLDGIFTGNLKVDFVSRVQLPEGERVSISLVDLVLRVTADAAMLRDFLNRETVITCSDSASEGG